MDPASFVVPTGVGDRYEIERELGRGGMATVYLARDTRHDRRVAVKVMHPDVSASLGAERFQREVRVLAQLSHPHILALYDSGRIPAALAVPGRAQPVSGELLYYVTPYVTGESLRDRLRREGQLPIGDALRIASEVADALSFAHGRGIVHRDIKPENVLLTGDRADTAGDSHAVVADFGIARLLAEAEPELTATGVSIGTPTYMSPEQASGERTVDARSDVYSLGCLLYEMLVGEPPFTGPTASVIVARHLTAPPPSIRAVRSSVSAELEALVHRALEKVPADRIATAADFKVGVDRIRARASADHLVGGDAARPRTGGFAADGHVRHRRAAVAAAVALAALGIGATWLQLAREPVVAPPTASPAALAAVPALDPRRVAVVPFRTVGDDADAYLALASADELISALGRMGGIRVLARSAVPSPDTAKRPVAELVRGAGAGSFVEGTFYQRGDSVRFNVTLVDAKAGEQLWGETYERAAHQLAGLQDSVAAAVARRLAAFGDVKPASASGRPMTTNGAAHDAYLRGLYLLNSSPVLPLAVADSAFALFERATELDSGFALAYAAAARVANTIYFNIDPTPIWEERAFVAIEKALALDPNLAEAHQEKGSHTWTRSKGFPHEASARLHRKALALKPSFVDPHNSLGSLYMHVGLLDRALAEYDTALALDPAGTFAPPRIPRVHWYQGRYAQALLEYEALANRRNPMLAERALVLNYLGRRAEALAVLDAALRRSPNPLNYDLHASRAVVLAADGRRDEAREAIRLVLSGDTTASHFHHAAYSLAQAYALLGDHDNALEFLRRTARDGMPCYPLFQNDPHLNSLRADPRFKQFMSDMRQQFERLQRTIE